jgi:hypothetical protein
MLEQTDSFGILGSNPSAGVEGVTLPHHPILTEDSVRAQQRSCWHVEKTGVFERSEKSSISPTTRFTRGIRVLAWKSTFLSC